MHPKMNRVESLGMCILAFSRVLFVCSKLEKIGLGVGFRARHSDVNIQNRYGVCDWHEMVINEVELEAGVLVEVK